MVISLLLLTNPNRIQDPHKKGKGKKNQTKEKQKDKNAMAMVPYEGTTRDGSIVNLNDTKKATETKEFGTQTVER